MRFSDYVIKTFLKKFSFLIKKNNLLSYGFDYLRLKFDFPSIKYLEELNENSTLGSTILKDGFLINFIKTSVWNAYIFNENYEGLNWFYQMLPSFRILQNKKNNTILIDFYWLFFSYYENYEEKISKILEILWIKNEQFQVTRCDFQITVKNFQQYYLDKKKELEKTNSITKNFKFDINRDIELFKNLNERYEKTLFNLSNTGFQYWIYQKKWKWKVGYTKWIWIRSYQKYIQIKENWLLNYYWRWIYFDFKEAYRYELTFWSDIFSWFFWNIKEFEDYFYKKIFNTSKNNIENDILENKCTLNKNIPFQEKAYYRRFQKIKDYKLDKKTKDLQTQVLNYLVEGGSISHLLPSIFPNMDALFQDILKLIYFYEDNLKYYISKEKYNESYNCILEKLMLLKWCIVEHFQIKKKVDYKLNKKNFQNLKK